VRGRSPRRARRSTRRPRAPWRRWFPLLAVLGLLLLAPALTHAQGATQDSVTLGWTAVGDDSLSGTAAAYELRRAGAPITEATWGSATAVAGLPAPLASGTPQQVVVRGLARGATYYFALRARDDAGNWSGLSNVVRWDTGLDATPPAAPAGLAVGPLDQGLHLTWSPSAAPDLAGYSVYRATAAVGPFVKLNTSLLTATEYQDDALPAGEGSLWYQATATNTGGAESARSASVSWVIPPPPAPHAAPAGLAVVPRDQGMHLTWSPCTAPDHAGYSVYRATAAVGPFVKLTASLLTAAEYQDDALPAGADSLWYRASATNTGGVEGTCSASVLAVLLASAPPAAPTGLVTEARGDGIHLTWSPSAAPDLAGYSVYRATAAAGPFVKLTASLLTVNEYQDDALPAGADSLWYQATATTVGGTESAHSAGVPIAPAPPIAESPVLALGIAPAYPNPSRVGQDVTIPVGLTVAGGARVDIVDAAGHLVRRLEPRPEPGPQDVVWDGRNDAGRTVAPGPYRAWLVAGELRRSIRLARTP
jgi:hypothetical protein